MGYKFVGWDNLPETMPAADVTVVAKFEKIPEYQVTTKPDTTTPNVGTPNNNNNSSTSSSGNHSSTPQTGIEFNLAVYVAIMMFALLMILVLVKKRPENS